jgi:hypothetical protein
LLTARYPGADAVTLEIGGHADRAADKWRRQDLLYSLNQAAGNQMQLRTST